MTQTKNTDHIWVRNSDIAQGNSGQATAEGPARPASPCVKVCVIDPENELCIGCLRSRNEIASWGSLSAQQQIDLLSTLDDRKNNMIKRSRRGGRAAKRPPSHS